MSWQTLEEELLCDTCKHSKELHLPGYGCMHSPDNITHCTCQKSSTND